MEWLAGPLIILCIGVWLRGWPKFITHNHYYNKKEKEDGE
jgi:hypothetical protein